MSRWQANTALHCLFMVQVFLDLDCFVFCPLSFHPNRYILPHGIGSLAEKRMNPPSMNKTGVIQLMPNNYVAFVSL